MCLKNILSGTTATSHVWYLGGVIFFGVGMALLEEVFHCGVNFDVSCTQAFHRGRAHFLWPPYQDGKLSPHSPSPCLPAFYVPP